MKKRRRKHILYGMARISKLLCFYLNYKDYYWQL